MALEKTETILEEDFRHILEKYGARKPPMWQLTKGHWPHFGEVWHPKTINVASEQRKCGACGHVPPPQLGKCGKWFATFDQKWHFFRHIQWPQPQPQPQP